MINQPIGIDAPDAESRINFTEDSSDIMVRSDLEKPQSGLDQSSSNRGGSFGSCCELEQSVGGEREKLLRNVKKQVKRMMEEAVTRKFIHENSSSIISLCVAVDACLTHGLKRRVLGLFKTNSSTALLQKVSKNCKAAQEVLEWAAEEERRLQNRPAPSSASFGPNEAPPTTLGARLVTNLSPLKRPQWNQAHLMSSGAANQRRNLWIKCALLENKLVEIVEHLAANSSSYYENNALMSDPLSAQLLSSLLVGPLALEYSRSKLNDPSAEDPTASELIERHKLANPIACLCESAPIPRHKQLAESSTSGPSLSCASASASSSSFSASGCISNSYCSSANFRLKASSLSEGSQHWRGTELAHNRQELPSRTPSDLNHVTHDQCSRKWWTGSSGGHRRRRPLSLKSATGRQGVLVTDCHHLSCQELSEHQLTSGYSIICASEAPNAASEVSKPQSQLHAPLGQTLSAELIGKTEQQVQLKEQRHLMSEIRLTQQQKQDWPPLWSPRMLHETLHQNSRSKLIYAKNNVLLEIQPNETIAGYLSLHQAGSDLILKWIPNQMINGSQLQQQPDNNSCCCNATTNNNIRDKRQVEKEASDQITQTPEATPLGESNLQPVALKRSYIDLVVCLSLSRIVLLHCQFGKHSSDVNMSEKQANKDGANPTLNDDCNNNSIEQQHPSDGTNQSQKDCEEVLILVEADGIQRAPFKFPKGGLRVFLSCLESGLQPDKYLDPAIKFEGFQDAESGANSAHNIDTSSNPVGLARFDSILKRLPSLKRKLSSSVSNVPSQTNEPNTLSETGSETNSRSSSPYFDQNSHASSTKTVSHDIEANHNSQNPTASSNYVYRIVASQQPDWPLSTPPHSALSIGSSSSGSFGQQSWGKQPVVPGGGQMFRWSLSRLANFSSKYTKSGSTTSSISVGQNSMAYDSTSLTAENRSLNDTFDQQQSTASASDLYEPNKGLSVVHRENSCELARIEAKLENLKTSNSHELLALRTTSLQTLCTSMRKQMVARAFYGWMAHCRKARLVRAHLIDLLEIDDADSPIDIETIEPKTNLGRKKLVLSLDDPSKLNHSFEQPGEGLSEEKWNELIKNEEKLGEKELRAKICKLIYFGGIRSNELRCKVWPYLLSHYNFCDQFSDKQAKDLKLQEMYSSCRQEWTKIDLVVRQRDNELLAENIAKASKRLNGNKENSDNLDNQVAESSQSDYRSDITELDSLNERDIKEEEEKDEDKVTRTNDAMQNSDEESHKANKDAPQKSCKPRSSSFRRQKAKAKRKRRPRLESTGSVGSDASITDQFGNNIHRIDKDVQRCDRSYWYFKDTKNLDKLRNVMCSYVWQHLDVGYVQGMCDLAAPFLVIFDDEVMAFSCFSRLMKRMVSNFPQGNAMDQHFDRLGHLMQVLDPKLFDVLQSNGDYTHFYFCYRWLLLDFKRELVYEDVFRVWETIWSARLIVTEQFIIFVALAMVRFYRDIIIENSMDFTDTIKFFNEMAERHDADKILALARDCVSELQSLVKVSLKTEVD